jgi:hypothetical protein
MEESKNSALYRLDPDLSVHKIEDGIIVSNGPCWSPDARLFYFADSWAGEIWANDYDVDTGRVSKQADLHQARYLARRRARRLDRGCRGLPLERPDLGWQDRPLPAHRRGRLGDRHAGQEGHQRDVRRPQSRHAVRHLDGKTAAAALSRRRRAAGESVWAPISTRCSSPRWQNRRCRTFPATACRGGVCLRSTGLVSRASPSPVSPASAIKLIARAKAPQLPTRRSKRDRAGRPPSLYLSELSQAKLSRAYEVGIQ